MKRQPQVINYEGMQYAPEGELGVVYLFSKFQRKLGYIAITRIRDDFPDCEAIKHSGRKVRIEFEFRSRNFITQHRPLNEALTKVDAIICWEDNWPPEKRKDLHRHNVEIVELRKYLGLSKNVWFHIIKKKHRDNYMEDLLHGSKIGDLPCNKGAKRGDLLLDYFGAPLSRIQGAEMLTSDAYPTKGKEFKYRAKVRRIAVLDKPIHMTKMRNEASLTGAFFLKPNGLQGSPRVTEYWPQLSEIILRLNPKLKSKLKKYFDWN